MVRLSLSAHSNACVFVSKTITVPKMGEAAIPNIRRNILITNCVPFTVYIREIHNIQIDNGKYIYIVIPMYNLIEYSGS